MSEAQCYLCAKPGKFEKLFRRCKHESACRDCLRDRYVIQAPQFCHVSSSSPYKCFHPDCDLQVREVQLKRLVRCEQEMQEYFNVKMQPKIERINAKKNKRIQSFNTKKHSEIQLVQHQMDLKLKSYDAMKHEEKQEAWFGPDWQDIAEALGEKLVYKISRCPVCHVLITKDGGCFHMTCICGAEFNWNVSRQSIRSFCQNIDGKYQNLINNLHSRTFFTCNKIERKYDRLIHDLDANMIARTTWSSVTATHQPKKVARRAPLLSMDDESVEDSSEGYSVEESPDFCPDEDETSPPDRTTSVHLTTSDLDSVPSDFDIRSSPSISPVETSVVDSEQDFHVLELASDSSGDSWTQFNTESESSIITDSDFRTTTSQTTWEEVSEVSSVVSFHSKTGISFLEAARAKASNQPLTQNRWNEVLKAPKPRIRLQTITEHRKPMVGQLFEFDDDDHVGEMFDADFMYDGAKCSRGGKRKFRFNRQPKRKNR